MPVVTRFILQKLHRRQRLIVLYANANLITVSWHLRKDISQSPEIIVLNDGVALDLAAIFKYGTRFPDNLNGTDFTPVFLSNLNVDSRVFLLGGRPGVAEKAAQALSSFPKAEVCGCLDGYSIWEDEAATIGTINQARPDILLVALGNPRQEEWILRHRQALAVPLIFGVGALLDFLSGSVPRAPMLLRRLKLEWAYRLSLEPRRLVGRYTIGIMRFFWMVLLNRNDT